MSSLNEDDSFDKVLISTHECCMSGGYECKKTIVDAFDRTKNSAGKSLNRSTAQ